MFWKVGKPVLTATTFARHGISRPCGEENAQRWVLYGSLEERKSPQSLVDDLFGVWWFIPDELENFA